MPEYFIALVKQFGNLYSTQEAENVVKDLASSLLLNLNEDQSKLFLAYTPQYLHLKPNIFKETIRKSKREYQHAAFMERIKIIEGLTDTEEVSNRLKAFFKAIKIVSDKKQYSNLYSVMPQDIKQIISSV